MVSARASIEAIWGWLDEVPDPEIPVISVVDLGIVRRIAWNDDNTLEVAITPTYSGCPAGTVIRDDIEAALRKNGVTELAISTELSPAWTTDWLSEKGRSALSNFGIAPPRAAGTPECCPHCQSRTVEKISQFGSTPCKAQWRCCECLEPFDYFKCL